MNLHPAQEARVFLAPPSDISTADWGAKNHELSIKTSAYSGPWSLDLIPFMRGYLDFLDDDTVREVTLQKPTQEAGSETTLVWLMRVAAEDPGPAMWVFADEDTAKTFCESRILPAFRASPALSGLIIEAKFGQKEIVLKNGFSLLMTWASSISKTASVPIRYLVMDEICKPAYSMTQGEGNVISRIRQRVQKFPNYKAVMLSSVTLEGDNMTKETAKTDAAFDYHLACPHCGEEQPVAFKAQIPKAAGAAELDRDDHPATEATGEVIFPKDGTIRERAAAARYRCRSCSAEWTTAEKNRASAQGRWRPRPNSTPNPKRVSLYLSRLVSLSSGGRLESLVEDFLQSKDDPENLQSFVNNALGEHWRRTRAIHAEDHLRKAETAIPTGVIPPAADCLVCTIDVQQAGFWYVVRAWQSSLRQSWLIEWGQVGTWEDIDELVFERTWAKDDGTAIGVWRAGIDTGGTKEAGAIISRVEEAYEWWIKNRHRARGKVFLCKGSSRGMTSKLSIGKVLVTSPSGKKINQFGMQIVELNTPALKRLFLHAISQATEQGSGAAYLHAEMDPRYYRHITAEEEDEHGNFERIRTDNHALDCEATQFALISRELHGGIDEFARRTTIAKTRQDAAKAAPQKPAPKQDGDNFWTSGVTQNPLRRRE